MKPWRHRRILFSHSVLKYAETLSGVEIHSQSSAAIHRPLHRTAAALLCFSSGGGNHCFTSHVFDHGAPPFRPIGFIGNSLKGRKVLANLHRRAAVVNLATLLIQSAEVDCPKHRRPYEFSWFFRLRCGQLLRYTAPFCPKPVLVNHDGGAVNIAGFQVGILHKNGVYLLPHLVFTPASP